MIRWRVSLTQLMGLVAALAAGLAAMKVAAGWLARGLVLGALVGLLVATLGSILRRRRRGAWAGLALFGWGYVLVAAAGPFLADQYNGGDVFDIWRVDGAIRPLAARLHSEPTAPADPFPSNAINLDPATGVRTMTVGSQVVPLTPAETKLQIDFEARTAIHQARSDAGRHARAIGLSIQGVAFALIGAVVGHALSDEIPAPGESPGAEPPTLPDGSMKEVIMSSVLERSPVDASATPEESPYLFSVDEFYRLLESEFFPREARVGLWDGRIYEKMAKTQAHAVAGNKANIALIRTLPPGWFLGGENPITVGPKSAPLPDLVILRGEPDDYIDRRPEAADVGLVVEFSLSSLKHDTGPKLAAYASAGISAYWVLNLVDGVIHVYSDPVPAEGRFASAATVKRGESFPFTLGGVPVGPIAASDLLPAR